MPHIRIVPVDQARGLLRKLYDEAIRRAGKIFHIIDIQSLRPQTLRASTQLYQEVMFSPRSPLTRARREMIAVVVSQVNQCHY